jgi:hypothetical protein
LSDDGDDELDEVVRIGTRINNLRAVTNTLADQRALLLYRIYARGGWSMRRLGARVGLCGPRIKAILDRGEVLTHNPNKIR